MSNENYPKHEEAFEVVLLKSNVSEVDAKPEDFKRVHVSASSTLEAQMHKDLEKETKDHRVIFVTKPGVPTEAETMALRRSMEGPPVDYTKI